MDLDSKDLVRRDYQPREVQVLDGRGFEVGSVDTGFPRISDPSPNRRTEVPEWASDAYRKAW